MDIHKFTRLSVELLQLLVQFFQSLREVELVRCAVGYADVATGVQAPALVFDVLERGHLAQARHIVVAQLGEPLGESRLPPLRSIR